MQTSEEKFIGFILEHLIDDAKVTDIVRTEDELGVLLTVTVPKESMGKVIGKSGKHVEAMKTLLKVISAKNGSRIALKITEKE